MASRRALGGIAAGLAAALVFVQCAKLDHFEHDMTTAEGIMVRTRGYAPDPDLIDAKYRETVACLADVQREFVYEERPFVIEIRSGAGERFRCMMGDGWHLCTGLYDPATSTIALDEAVRAFSHELVHHAGEWEHTMVVRECGDRVDSRYNDDDTPEDEPPDPPVPPPRPEASRSG